MPRRTIVPPAAISPQLTLAPLRHGFGDPTCRITAEDAWLAFRTPDGPATVRVTVGPEATLEVQAWGDGAAAALAEAPSLLGVDDDLDGFEPRDAIVAELAHRLPGLRIPRTGRVVDALLPLVLEQRVTTFEAHRSWELLVHRTSEPAPGPGDLWLPPDVGAVASAPYYDLHQLGIERRRADTLRRVASLAARLEPLAAGPSVDLQERLASVSGIGPWTAAQVALVVLGDPDAVPVGDLHLPSHITWALAGEAKGDDDRMLELLVPYRGHRGRVVLLVLAGASGPARHAPRAAIRSILDS